MFDTKEDKETIGKRIRAVRRQRDMTQVQLAEQLTLRGIKKNQTDIAKYESGVYMPREVTLNTICSILEIDPNYIVFGIESSLITKPIPVGKDYNLRVINYSDAAKQQMGISKAISFEKLSKINNSKEEIKKLADDYLKNYDSIISDHTWNDEDLYAVYLFCSFIKYKHAAGRDDNHEVHENLFDKDEEQ